MIDVQMSVELSYLLALLWFVATLGAIVGSAYWAGCAHAKGKDTSWAWGCVIAWSLFALPMAVHDLAQWYSLLGEARGW